MSEMKIDLTDESVRDEVERAVLFPEARAQDYVFLGQKVRLCALPIFYARKIGAALGPFKKQMQGVVAKGVESLKSPSLGQDQLDEDVVKALVDTAVILAEFYELPLPQEKIERNASFEDLLALAEAQLEVNGKSDFLLLPLRIITKIGSTIHLVVDDLEKSDPTKVVNPSS